jgi:hypothetical protein
MKSGSPANIIYDINTALHGCALELYSSPVTPGVAFAYLSNNVVASFSFNVPFFHAVNSASALCVNAFGFCNATPIIVLLLGIEVFKSATKS